jgi:hypothetical protein
VISFQQILQHGFSETVFIFILFISDKSKDIFIIGEVGKKEFIKSEVDFSMPLKITINSYGGLVIKTLSA